MTAALNGRAPAPFTIAPFTIPLSLQPRGPVSVLPSAAVQDRPAPSRTVRRAVDGDTAIRVLAAAVVLAVAAFAAIVSYSHIFELGRSHGQDGTAARLLPLSVDGLIASASLAMLHARRNGIRLGRMSLPRVMLWFGVGATVAANVGYGLPFGWLAAVVSAWPAVAFVGSVEMAVRFVRDGRQDNGASDQPVVTPRHDSEDDKRDDKPPRVPPRKPAPAATKQARAAAVIRDNPGLANAALAALAGCDIRTISRARNNPGSKT
jgi:hypothetical protein